jgi:hypothetical protein
MKKKPTSIQQTRDMSLLNQRTNELTTIDRSKDTPFSRPEDVESNTKMTHPKTDAKSDIDDHELYDEGLDGAVEANPPNKDQMPLSEDGARSST